MDIFKRTLKDREAKAMGEDKPKAETKPKAEAKPKGSMSQADFSYGKEKKYAKGGMTRTGPDSARDSKGWERDNDGNMSKDSAAIRRAQASEIERETKRTVNRTKALDASTKMGNPARYAGGGMVKRGYGKARGGKC